MIDSATISLTAFVGAGGCGLLAIISKRIPSRFWPAYRLGFHSSTRIASTDRALDWFRHGIGDIYVGSVESYAPAWARWMTADNTASKLVVVCALLILVGSVAGVMAIAV